jgi:hypothetical protein
VQPDRRAVWRWVLAIIVVAAIARVGFAAWIAHADPAAVRPPDTPGYLEPARALIETGRFSLSPLVPLIALLAALGIRQTLSWLRRAAVTRPAPGDEQPIAAARVAAS